MKNIFIVFAILLATSISAQTFTPVDSVKQISDTEFIAYLNEQTISISAKEFVELNKKQHFLVVFTGDNPFNIFITKDEFIDEYISIKNIGLSGDSVIVLFDNNTKHITPMKQWINMSKGQIMRHIVISSSKRNFEKYLTVDESDVTGNITKALYKKAIKYPAVKPEQSQPIKNKIMSDTLPLPSIDV